MVDRMTEDSEHDSSDSAITQTGLASLGTGDPTSDPKGRYLAGLAMGALCIVYGDIGTSPLYALLRGVRWRWDLPVALLLFSVMSQNARSAASFFRLPPNRVVELGAQVEL